MTDAINDRALQQMAQSNSLAGVATSAIIGMNQAFMETYKTQQELFVETAIKVGTEIVEDQAQAAKAGMLNQAKGMIASAIGSALTGAVVMGGLVGQISYTNSLEDEQGALGEQDKSLSALNDGILNPEEGAESIVEGGLPEQMEGEAPLQGAGQGGAAAGEVAGVDEEIEVVARDVDTQMQQQDEESQDAINQRARSLTRHFSQEGVTSKEIMSSVPVRDGEISLTDNSEEAQLKIKESIRGCSSEEQTKVLDSIKSLKSKISSEQDQVRFKLQSLKEKFQPFLSGPMGQAIGGLISSSLNASFTTQSAQDKAAEICASQGVQSLNMLLQKQSAASDTFYQGAQSSLQALQAFIRSNTAV